MRALFFLTLAFCLYSSPSYARAYCTGTITGIYVQSNGDVITRPSWRGDWIAVCNVKAERLGVSTEVCWAWQSLLNEAFTNGNQTTISFDNFESSDCPTLPTYSGTPAPYYVLRK